MEDAIQQIIEKANKSGLTGYELAKFVHIELGKLLYYNNNYTVKLMTNSKEDETELSRTRKKNIIEAETDKSSKAQVCRGMAEIYAEILNELDIEAKAIGIEHKGKTEEVKNGIGHYCAIFKIEEQEYVQDFLMEGALARIKIGEAELAENMPGICPIDEYEHMAKMGFIEYEDTEARETIPSIKLSPKYLNEMYGLNSDNLNIESIFNQAFNELNKYLKSKERNFGFEEAKDFVMVTIVNLMEKSGLTQTEIKDKMKNEVRITNLVKESETECGVSCIYEIKGRKYLVRGQDETTDIRVPVGEISDSDLTDILKQGYEGRVQKDREKLKIQEELAKWSDEKFLEETRIKLCEYVNDLDNIFCERYKKIIKGLKPEIREEALNTLKNKGLFDDDMNYIGSSNIVKFDREKKVANGGYLNGSIIINPNSARQFYDAYMDFADGKREGIRDNDYSKPLADLKDLSSLEVLYWHYFNQRPYQDFLKSTMLHENVHRWTLEATFIDDPIDIYAMEGYVEREARDIAEANNIEYSGCFRNDEINFINYLSRSSDKTDNIISMLYHANSNDCLLFAIKIEMLRRIKEISPEKATALAFELYEDLNNQVKNDSTNSIGKNFREVFSGIKPNKSYQLIDLIENVMAREETLMSDEGIKNLASGKDKKLVVMQKYDATATVADLEQSQETQKDASEVALNDE